MENEITTATAKRKTHTSNAVKDRWKAKNYKVVSAALNKDLVTAFETQLSNDEQTKAEFLRKNIQNYLEKGLTYWK